MNEERRSNNSNSLHQLWSGTERTKVCLPGTATRSAVFLKLPPWRMRLGPTLGKPFTVEMLAKRDDREERATTK